MASTVICPRTLRAAVLALAGWAEDVKCDSPFWCYQIGAPALVHGDAARFMRISDKNDAVLS